MGGELLASRAGLFAAEEGVAACTIATMPALIAGGSLGHAAATNANSVVVCFA